jgi:hypothetical protein
VNFGDIDGLNRAAVDLDHLSQVADQHLRGVNAAATAVVTVDTWHGTAASAFAERAVYIDKRLGGAVSTASRSAIVLRRLATDLDAARALAEGARRTAAAAGIAVTPTYEVPGDLTPGRCTYQSDIDAGERASSSFDEAREAAERAWRAAAAGLQEIWSPWLDQAHQAKAVGSTTGVLLLPAAAADRRKEVTKYWDTARKAADARRRSGLRGAELTRARGEYKLATERWWANSRQYDRSWSATKEGLYAWAGKAHERQAGTFLGKAGKLRGAKGIPVVGAAMAGVGTYADIQEGVDPKRAIAANAASLVAATAAVALVSGPAMPLVATALVIGVVGYGVGNAVHGLIAHGDILHDFKSDWHDVSRGARWVGDKTSQAAGGIFKAITPW